MSVGRLIRCSSPRIRRLVTAAAIVAYLASVWGFPLPTADTRDLSTPFPCQDHHCGCNSAAQCWHSCCCYTPAERLAWAHAHGVELSADAEARLIAAVAAPAAAATCCRHHDDESHHDEPGHACADCKSHDDSASIVWVLGIEARKCQGLATLWITCGAALPLTILPLWQFDWAPAGAVCVAADQSSALAYAPSVPPPRA